MYLHSFEVDRVNSEENRVQSPAMLHLLTTKAVKSRAVSDSLLSFIINATDGDIKTCCDARI